MNILSIMVYKSGFCRMIFAFIFIVFIFISCENRGESKSVVEKNSARHSLDSIGSISGLNVLEDSIPFNIDDIGFELMKSESIGGLKLDLNIAQIEEIIGKPDSVSDNILWAADGDYHQQFYYPKVGVELDMVGGDNSKLINMITIFSPCILKTSKKIGIGSSFSDVQKLYSEYINKSFSNLETVVVGSIYGGIIFSFDEEKVVSIFIGAAAD